MPGVALSAGGVSAAASSAPEASAAAAEPASKVRRVSVGEVSRSFVMRRSNNPSLSLFQFAREESGPHSCIGRTRHRRLAVCRYGGTQPHRNYPRWLVAALLWKSRLERHASGQNGPTGARATLVRGDAPWRLPRAVFDLCDCDDGRQYRARHQLLGAVSEISFAGIGGLRCVVALAAVSCVLGG